MDAVINTTGPHENYEDETYRGYLISYERTGGTFYVSKSGYHRGISSLRKDAKRWIDLLISGEISPDNRKSKRKSRSPEPQHNAHMSDWFATQPLERVKFS